MPVFRIRIHLIRIRIQNFGLNTDPDPGFWWPKLKQFTAKKIFFLNQKLSIRLQKVRLSYRRSLQPSKENIQHFKTWFLIRIQSDVWMRVMIKKGQNSLHKKGKNLRNPCLTTWMFSLEGWMFHEIYFCSSKTSSEIPQMAGIGFGLSESGSETLSFYDVSTRK